MKSIYNLSLQEVRKKLKTNLKTGLSVAEAQRKVLEHGYNILPSKKKRSIFSIILDQFKDFMVLVLIIAVIISGFMGEVVDAVAILAIVILNAVMGFVQEYKAEKSLEALKKLSAAKARVIRDGTSREVPARQLVVGDVISLETGDKVPADARIIEAANLKVNEASLTGESEAVSKDNQLLSGTTKVSDRSNMLHMGSYLQFGTAKAVVIATGKDTEMGRIANLLTEKEEIKTPLQKRLHELGIWIVGFCFVACFAVVVMGVLRGEVVGKMLMAGVSLAVAAIPEGLPAVVTLSLALGVQRMIKRNVIVRKLPAVETLGCANVICSDKTGTLTGNKMSVESFYISDQVVSAIDSQFDKSKKNRLKDLLKASLICNRAEYNNGEIFGEPTEKALLRGAREFGISKEQFMEAASERFEVPFSSARKRMSVIIKEEGDYNLYIKGAVDILLDRFDSYQHEGRIKAMNSKMKQKIKRINKELASEALRVLAVGKRKLGKIINDDELEQYENNITFLGLVGMIDLPRPEVKEAIANCRKAGIDVKMITGDHKETAVAIGKKLNLLSSGSKVIVGSQLSKMKQQELEEIIDDVTIFARVAPEDKLRIVEALQSKDYIVGMTGDGVNDAPAVKRADIGIAMGEEGTDVTKEASSLVLTDDNFNGIVAAIEEGRGIYNNIRKFIRYLLSCNIGEILTMFLASFLGLPLPLMPIQILWINLITDGFPALALGVDPADDDIMEQKPRDKQEGVFSQGLQWRIMGQGLLIGLGTIMVFLFGLTYYDSLQLARTMAFTNLVVAQLLFVFSCRSEKHSVFSLNPFTNLYLLLAVTVSGLIHLAVIYLSIFQSVFNTVPLSLKEWSFIFLVAIASTVILEVAQFMINLVKNSINYIEYKQT